MRGEKSNKLEKNALWVFVLVYAGAETGSRDTETVNPKKHSFTEIPSNPHMLYDLDHISVLLHISDNLIYGCVKQ